MTSPRPQHGPNGRSRASSLEPLPSTIETPLREIDDRIAREIAGPVMRRGIPAGLEDRVYDASVGLLPRSAPAAARTPARRSRPVVARIGVGARVGARVGFGRTPWHQAGGRLALAASVGLVFVVAAFFMNRQAAMPGGVEAGGELVLASDLSWLGPEVSKEQRQVAHLLDTGDLSSFSELTLELETAMDEIGM